MKLPRVYMIDYPASAQLVLSMQGYGNTTEFDMSLGDDHDATLTGMATRNLAITDTGGRWLQSRPFRSGYEFAATYMTNAGWQPLDGIGKFSFEAWIIPDRVDSTYGVIFEQYVDATHKVYCQRYEDDIVFGIAAAAGDVNVTAAAVLSVGTLVHVVGVWDKDDNSGKLTLYIDNSATTSGAGVAAVTDASSDFQVGSSRGGVAFTKLGVLCKLIVDTSAKWGASTVASLYNREITLPLAMTTGGMWEMRAQTGTTAFTQFHRRDGLYGRSMWFANASNNQLVVADHADLEPGGNDFTFACKAFSSDLSDDDSFLLLKTAALSINVDTAGNIEVIGIGVATDTITTTDTPFTENTWHSVVVRRTSDVLSIHVDKVASALDSSTFDETIAANANDWEIGGDGANTMEAMGLTIWDPTASYSTRWISDFHDGLPTMPVGEDPVEGPSSLSFTIMDPSGEYAATRFHNDDLYQTQVLCWMGDKTKGLYPKFWRGHVQEIQHTVRPRGIAVQCVDHSIVLETSHDVTYGRTENTTSEQDLYDTIDAVIDAAQGITIAHTPNPLGLTREYTVSIGTTRAQVIRDVYNDYMIPGYVDPWNDHWLRPRHTEPHDIDDWTDNAGDWTNDADGVVALEGGGEISWTSGAALRELDVYRTVTVSSVDFPYLSLEFEQQADAEFTTEKLELRLRCGAGNYYSYILDESVIAFGASQKVTLLFRLPSEHSNFSWTETGTCDPTAIDRVWWWGVNSQTGGTEIRWDHLHFFGLSDTPPTAVLPDASVIGGTSTVFSRQNVAKSARYEYNDAGSGVTVDQALPEYGDAWLVFSTPANTSATQGFTHIFAQLARNICPCVPAGPVSMPWDNQFLFLRRGDAIHLTSTAGGLSTEKVFIQNIRIIPAEGRIEAVFNWNKLTKVPLPTAPPPAGIRVPTPPLGPLVLPHFRVLHPLAAQMFNVPDPAVAKPPKETVWPAFHDQDDEAFKWRRRYYV